MRARNKLTEEATIGGSFVNLTGGGIYGKVLDRVRVSFTVSLAQVKILGGVRLGKEGKGKK